MPSCSIKLPLRHGTMATLFTTPLFTGEAIPIDGPEDVPPTLKGIRSIMIEPGVRATFYSGMTLTGISTSTDPTTRNYIIFSKSKAPPPKTIEKLQRQDPTGVFLTSSTPFMRFTIEEVDIPPVGFYPDPTIAFPPQRQGPLQRPGQNRQVPVGPASAVPPQLPPPQRQGPSQQAPSVTPIQQTSQPRQPAPVTQPQRGTSSAIRLPTNIPIIPVPPLFPIIPTNMQGSPLVPNVTSPDLYTSSPALANNPLTPVVIPNPRTLKSTRFPIWAVSLLVVIFIFILVALVFFLTKKGY